MSGPVPEPAVSWYDVLGMLGPEMISGAPAKVLKAVSRAEAILDAAWRVLGDPVARAL